MFRTLFIVPFVLAALLPMHRLPVPSFLREWLVVAALLIASLYALKSKYRVTLRMDSFVAVLSLLACATVIQGVGHVASVPMVLLYLGYIGIAAVAYQAGSEISQSSQRETVVISLAIAVLLAAAYSCLTAAFQLSHVSLPFDLIFPPSPSGVSGNLAQPNHFNDLSWLGIVASCFLMERRVLRPFLAWAAIVTLVAFSVLCSSRAGLIYASIGGVLPLVARRYGSLKVQVQHTGLIILGLYVSLFAIFTVAGVAEHFGFHGLATRVIHSGGLEAGASEIRFAYWQSVLTNLHAVGAGAGNFRLEMLRAPEIWLSAGLRKGGMEHAHNFFLDIGVEYGWIVMLAMTALLLHWLWARRGIVLDASAFWAASVVSIIGTHAMLEYPLYYANFLIPFCLALGLLAPAGKAFRSWEVPRSACVIVLVVCLSVLATAYRHYQQVDDVFFQFQFGKNNTQQDKYEAFAVLDELSVHSPYKPYASIIKSMLASDEDVRRGLIAKDCDNVTRVWLSHASLAKCAASYQLYGSPSKAQVVMTGLCAMAGENASALVGDFTRIVGKPVEPQVLDNCLRVVAAQAVVH